MIRIGFSTQRSNPASALIRWFTGSEASHAWLLLIDDDAFRDIPMVLEATEVGVRCVPYKVFARKNDVVTLFDLPPSSCCMSIGVEWAMQHLGSNYDFAGLLANAWVSLGRWLKKKWRNPLSSPDVLFCSEMVVRVLQASGYMAAEHLDPESTSPQDLINLLRRQDCGETKLSRG